MKVVVASSNPVKIAAVEAAFRKCFVDEHLIMDSLAVESGVSDQPMSDEETLVGALNRVHQAKLNRPDANYWVSMEGGVIDLGTEMITTVWAVVLTDRAVGKGKAGSFVLPNAIANLIRDGMEMGPADDLIFGTSNSKQNQGGVGILTHGVIDRTSLYETGVVLALTRHLNEDLYLR